jgi:hypothetical protein
MIPVAGMQNPHLLAITADQPRGAQPVIEPDTVQMTLGKRVPGGMLFLNERERGRKPEGIGSGLHTFPKPRATGFSAKKIKKKRFPPQDPAFSRGSNEFSGVDLERKQPRTDTDTRGPMQVRKKNSRQVGSTSISD